MPAAVMGRFDRALVAWVALALALMLLALPWQRLVPTDGVQDGVSQAPRYGDDAPLPSSGEEPSSQWFESFESFEDDAVVHDRHDFVLVWLRLDLPPVSQLEQDALHTRQLERPPLHTA